MASKQEIITEVIEKLSLLAKPNVSPTEAPMEYARLVNLYVEALEDFDLEAIRGGMLLMQKDWMGNKWPAPGKLHHYFTEAQKERREALPRQPLPALDIPRVSTEERERVAGQLGRWLALEKDGRLGKMTHEEAYDAVYIEEPWPGHKADRLASIARIVGK